MKTMKRLSTMLLAGAMTVGMLAGCGSSSNGGTATGSGTASGGDKVSVGYVNLANTDVFCMSREEALTAVSDSNGGTLNISFTDGNNDNQKQLDQANSFLAKGVDVLVLVPCDSAAIVPAITAANNANVPVVCFGIKASDGDFTFVGSDNYDSGYMQGEYMAEKLEQGAKICYLAGTSGLDHAAARRQGLKDALEKAGRTDIEIIEDQDADYTKSKAMEKVDAWVQAYSDGAGGVTFDAIVAANDQMALGAVESLKAAGVLTDKGEILISGIDGTSEAVQMVADGYMCQTVLQDAQGQAEAAYDAITKLAAGESVDSEIMVPFQSITADNVADYQ